MFNKIYEYLYRRFRRKKNRPYGYVYLPNYNTRVKIVEGSSNLYNEYGEKLEEYFFRDKHFRAEPYRMSRYFIFDRYNLGLKTHFYSHESMLETQGEPDHRYGLLCESPAIVPKSYRLFDKFKGLNKDFEYIFTYSDKILQSVDNARFVPFASFMYGATFCPPEHYAQKTRNVSIISSEKTMCELHKYRLSLAWKCKNEHLADTFGTFDGGPRVPLDTVLKDYRFTIAIENSEEPFFWTERLVSALANQTIPIYLGATQIDKFFNPDGIIRINTKSDIDKVLKMCTKEEYERRLPAVLDNYERVKEYTAPWDYLYLKYIHKNGIANE
jgi:hypothetical protein